jgi:hypothetical protein
MKHVLLIAVICSGLSGCAAHSTPSFALFGAYLPAWMLVAAIGVCAAVATHVATVATGLGETIRLQLLHCTAIGVTTAVVWWLMWFAI